MKVIDIYEFALYLNPKVSRGQTYRSICTGAEKRSKSPDYMFEALLDVVALLSFTPTGNEMLREENDSIWRTFFVEWLNEIKRKEKGAKRIQRETFVPVHQTKVNSRALIVAIYILLSYRPMFAYASSNGDLHSTSLLKDFLKMYGYDINVEHNKVSVVEQRPADVLSDFLFFCVLKNTVRNLKKNAKKGQLSSLTNNLIKNTKTYHENFMGVSEIEQSAGLVDDLEGFKAMDSGNKLESGYYSNRKQSRYKEFGKLLKKMSPEEFDKVQSVFEELFKFSKTDQLEEKLTAELNRFRDDLPESIKNTLDYELNPLEHVEYYKNVTDSDGKRIIDEIQKLIM